MESHTQLTTTNTSLLQQPHACLTYKSVSLNSSTQKSDWPSGQMVSHSCRQTGCPPPSSHPKKTTKKTNHKKKTPYTEKTGQGHLQPSRQVPPHNWWVVDKSYPPLSSVPPAITGHWWWVVDALLHLKGGEGRGGGGGGWMEMVAMPIPLPSKGAVATGYRRDTRRIAFHEERRLGQRI